MSDMWSMGASLVELFSELELWGDGDDDVDIEDEIMAHMQKKDIPESLASVTNTKLLMSLQECLSYSPTTRPSSLHFLDQLTAKLSM
jgi:serine/threonine protein kinase